MRTLFRYLTILLLFSLLLPACRKEWMEEQQTVINPNGEEREGSWVKVHYQAIASSSAGTKATLNDLHNYLFEQGDRLYVVDKSTGGEDLYGFMQLISGADATTAVFEGDLMYFVEKSAGVYEPERPADNFAITAKLVSEAQRTGPNPIYTFVEGNDGKIYSGPNFGYGQANDGYADSFKEAIRKYSLFQAEATFGKPTFHLEQQTAFLLFNLSFNDDITPSTPLTVTIANDVSGSNTTLFNHVVTPNAYHQTEFVAAFNGDGTVALSNAKMIVTGGSLGGGSGESKSLANATLQGNRYYNVVKAFVDLEYFTIQAGETNTEIEFPDYFKNSSFGLQYKRDSDPDWIDVSTSSSFPLSAGKSAIIRGKGSKYKFADAGNKNLFTSTAPCYIYGDIMSLFCNSSYNKKTAFDGSNNNALDGTFKNMANMDIHPARPLLLSAQTLSNYCYQEMFAGSGITRAPEFADNEGAFAANIPQYACKNMFQGCTSLKAAPELPANGTIGTQGYFGMFDGCTAMVTPPTRLAVSPSGNSTAHFQQMFQNCTSLLYSPALTASEVKQNGCRSMFNGCTSLLEAPEELSATIIGNNAYYCMFKGCSSLAKVPASLPATTASQSAYYQMFMNCAKLESAPVISAETLNDYCFKEMFSGCNSLRTVQDEFVFTNIPLQACYKMFCNCLALNGAPNMSSFTGNIAKEGCFQMFYGCGQMRKVPSKIEVSIVGEYGFKQMFYNCARITTAPDISSTAEIQTQGCYEMFKGCTNLKTAPELGATTLGTSAYYSMFEGCSSLVTPPSSLPATTLPATVYAKMFSGCSALESIPDFPHNSEVTYVLTNGSDKSSICYQMFYNCSALTKLDGKQLFNSSTPLAAFCFQDMFANCTRLASVPVNFLPATTLATSCYRGMFQSTAITRAPNLRAETLVTDCYRYMFNNCKSLVYIECYSTSPGSTAYTQNWLQNAKNSSDAEFHYRSGVSWARNEHGIPDQWTPVADTVTP